MPLARPAWPLRIHPHNRLRSTKFVTVIATAQVSILASDTPAITAITEARDTITIANGITGRITTVAIITTATTIGGTITARPR